MLSFIVILKYLREIHADLVYVKNGIYNFLDGYLYFGKDIFVIDYAIEYWHIELLYVILLIGRVIYWVDCCEREVPEGVWFEHKRCPLEVKVLIYPLAAILIAKDALAHFINNHILKNTYEETWDYNKERVILKAKRDKEKDLVLHYDYEDSKIEKDSMTWEEVFMDSTK